MVALALLLALALRLFHLGRQGLWSDEGYTALYAGMPLGEMLQTLARVDPHPPLYYLLIHAWLRVAGAGDLALRLPSALASTLAVAALFCLGRRLGGPAAGVAAAFLLALNPFAVWYGQEARMYAGLTLIGVIATLLFRRALERGAWSAWLAYAVAAIVGLYLHYFMAPLIAVHLALAYRACLWRPDRVRALAAFVAIGAAFLPWLRIASAPSSYGGWMEKVTLDEAVRRTLWAFAIGTSIYPEQGWRLAAPALAAGAIGLIVLRPWRRRGDLWLLLGWAAGPMLAAVAIQVVADRAAYHERYVGIGAPALMLAAGLGLAGLGTAARHRLGQARHRRGAARRAAAGLGGLGALGLAVALGVAVVAADARALAWHYLDPHFAKEDLRGAAAFIDRRATSPDVVLGAPGRLWLFQRYSVRQPPTVETDVVWENARLERELAAAIAGRGEVWLLPAGSAVDIAAERWLDARGYRLDDRWFGLAPVKSWRLADDPPPSGGAIELRAGAQTVLTLRDRASALDRGERFHIVRVVGDWTRLAPTEDLRESLRLYDSRGRVVAQVDRQLGGDADGTSGWPAGVPRRLRSALRVPPDLPAGPYAVRLIVYGAAGPLSALVDGTSPGADVPLGTLEIPAVGPSDPALLDLPTRDDRQLPGGLQLLGAELPEAPVAAGAAVPIVLHWRATSAGAFAPAVLGRTRLATRAAAAGTPPSAAALAGASPEVGALLRDDRILRIPRDAAGRREVEIRLDGSALALPLGQLAVEPAAASNALPSPAVALDAALGPARLIGFDLAGQARPGGRLTLDLWFAPTGTIDDDLTVFVHLADVTGRPLAQDDRSPCGGRCPTSTWQPGDVLLDQHELALPTDLPPGRYALLVGLYDPRTGQRLTRADAPSGQPNDRVELATVDVAG